MPMRHRSGMMIASYIKTLKVMAAGQSYIYMTALGETKLNEDGRKEEGKI